MVAKPLMLGLVLVLAFGACATGVEKSRPPTVPTGEAQTSAELGKPDVSNNPRNSSNKKLASELQGDGRWINSEPFTLESQRGKVVLIDFWTYSCINCIRTLPHLKEWHAKYRDKGLVIVGVHTPEFRFEEDFDNVSEAVVDEGITWAVMQDNDRETWDAYNNLYWPSKYLIDKNGVMRYFYGGEGGYDLTEDRIRELLEKTGADLSDVEFVSSVPERDSLEIDPSFDIRVESDGYRPPDRSGLEETYDPTFRDIQNADVTSELYLGFERGCQRNLFSNSKVADPLYCESKGVEATYLDSGESEDHRLYIQGQWLAENETLLHTRETKGYEDYLRLRFASKTVNLVADSSVPHEKVLVTLDGEPLTGANKGEDVVLDSDGRSFLIVDGPGLYGVVDLPAYGVHEIDLSPKSKDFIAYSYTFGVYAVGP